ncbi:MAG: hypothetical protein ACEPOZ_07140 [Marinifilaceae bacterium]
MQNNKIPDKLILKNALIKIDDFLTFGALGVIIFYSSKNIKSIWTLFLVALCIFLIYKFTKRIKNRNPQIIIDKDGIELCEEQVFFKWNKINYAYIKAHSKGSGQNAESIDYFHIRTNNKVTTKRIDDLQYSSKLVKKTIEFYSGRDIADASIKFRNEISKILSNNNSTKEIIDAFSKIKHRQIMLSILIILSILGSSIYLQMQIDFPYCFGIGFVTTGATCIIVGPLEEKRFRRKRYISDLTDEQFDKIAMKFQLKNPNNGQTAGMIFLGVVAIGIFVLSYFLSKD